MAGLWHKNMISFFKDAFSKNEKLINQLPNVRGKMLENEPLHKKNWFGVGGSAQVYFEPADAADLAHLLKNMPPIPLTILGAGSNVLIRDGGVPGLTVHLGKPFSQIYVENDLISCGASVSVMEVARTALKNSISGFEFLCGIPGSVGGAVRMNAGAYGLQMQDCIKSITIVTREGEIRVLSADELKDSFEYRKCLLPQEWIFVGAVLKGTLVKDSAVIREKMEANRQKREKGQPLGVRTAGSTFRNPDGTPAWQLIDKVGMRGAKQGGASVSTKHCNFLINNGNATAKDIEALGEEIRRQVLEKEGIQLEWEVKKIGVDKK